MRRVSPEIALLLAIALPASAMARSGSLAVVNAGQSGHELVERAAQELQPWVGGWARQAGVAALLVGDPHPGALPTGKPGEELARLTDRLRARRATQAELADLGQLLGVDYLLVMEVKKTSYQARLFSVRLQRYAPQGLEVKGNTLAGLQKYVLEQSQAKPASKKKQGHLRWWLWGLAAGIVAVSLGLSLSQGDDTSGDLRIRVVRP